MNESTMLAWAAYDAAVRNHGRDSAVAVSALSVVQQLVAFDEQARNTTSVRWWEL